jgi:elongation factor Ts
MPHKSGEPVNPGLSLTLKYQAHFLNQSNNFCSPHSGVSGKMSNITAESVKQLRVRTGLPMMDCKSALTEAGGDSEAAVEILRRRGLEVAAKRTDRETSFGRFGIYTGIDKPAGGIVELKCESAPVTQNEEFIQLANDMAEVVAKNPAVDSSEKLLAQPSPSKKGMTLGEVKDDLFNRIREVFNVGRMQRFEGSTGGYSHNSGTVSGVLLSVEGGDDETAKGIAMHVAAMRPAVLNVKDLDEETVAKERAILRDAALQEGKPESIVDKMVEGRLKNFYSQSVLAEQEYVKSESKETVAEHAKSKGMKLKGFVHWELGAG